MMRAAFLVLSFAPLLAAEGDGTTPLHRAVWQDDFDAVKRLLKNGEDAKAPNRYGVTALSLACTSGNAAIVELLLDAGADANTTSPGGETVLMTASRTGNVESVKSLLKRGAVVEAKENRRGQTALMWAAAEGHSGVIETLIAAGADVHARLSSGYTPFLFAVREGKIGAAKTLLKAKASANEIIEAPPTRSKLASGAGFPKPATSALLIAVINGHFELAAYLLDQGADPNWVGPGYTALHAITWVRKPGGGDNDPAPEGSGKLTSVDMVKKLAAKGADLNARMTKKLSVGLTGLNTMGATPFAMAARTGDAEMMRLLAKLGADPLLPTADRSTPLIVAAGLGTRSPGEDAGTETEVLEAVRVAIELGNDVDAVDGNGETAMHGAAYKNYPTVVEYLSSRAAKPEIWNRKNKYGWTPLTIARGYRFGNYKPSAVTTAALEKVMKNAGLPIPPDVKPDEARNSNYTAPGR